MFNVARKEWKWTKDNPSLIFLFPWAIRTLGRWLTIEQEENLIENATNPIWLRPLLITALHTGMRKERYSIFAGRTLISTENLSWL